MTTIDLKAEVQKAIRQEWPAFAAAHPRLAAVLDETVLVEEAIASLASDPEYQSAMNEAAAAGMVAETVGSVVTKIVSRFLRELI